MWPYLAENKKKQDNKNDPGHRNVRTTENKMFQIV